MKTSKKDHSIHVLRKIVIDGIVLCNLIICIHIMSSIWTPFERGFFCNDETLMYPYRSDTVSTTMLRLVGIGLPIVTFLICEWVVLRKALDDRRYCGIRLPVWIQGFYCAALSFGIGVCFVELSTIISKNTIGRPRPHFFDICKPSVNCSSSEWQGRYIQPHEFHCTGDRVDKFENMRKSFVSGHSSLSAFTMFYLALYLERRMTWHGTRVLRHTLQFCAVMLSWFTALSRVSDYKHHWSDVLAGYFLGIMMAVVVWTWGTDLVDKDTPAAKVSKELQNNHQQMGQPMSEKY